MCIKDVTPLSRYNFDKHEPILIILLTDKLPINQNMLYFPILQTSASATHGETGNPEITSFFLKRLNAICTLTFFDNRHTKHIHIITWSQLNHHSFAERSIVCTRQYLGMKKHNICRLLPSLLTFAKSVTVSVCCVKMVAFFVELGIKVSVPYYWDILLCQHKLNAIKHVANDNFVFQQEAALVPGPLAVSQDFRPLFSWAMQWLK